MSYEKKSKRLKFRLPRDSTLGIGIIISIIIVVATAVIYKNSSNNISEPNALEADTIRVIDGDTIEINSNKIRLFGIDAPEMGQPCSKNTSTHDCGAASKEYLEFIISGTIVKCDDRGKDRWNRIISICTTDGNDINRLMVRNGWAFAYREYSSAYVQDEEFAQTNKLGMWSKVFSSPSEWRKSKRGNKL